MHIGFVFPRVLLVRKSDVVEKNYHGNPNSHTDHWGWEHRILYEIQSWLGSLAMEFYEW